MSEKMFPDQKDPSMPTGPDPKKPEDKKPREFYHANPDGTVQFTDNPKKPVERDFNAEK